MQGPSNSCVAVVDDDESVCRSVGRLLRASGLQAVTYPSAEAFLADSNQPGYACLVLDIALTGMSGITLQERLASLGSRTPVIYLTSLADAAVEAQAARTGCFAYLRKTDPAARVLDAIRAAIASSSTEGHPR